MRRFGMRSAITLVAVVIVAVAGYQFFHGFRGAQESDRTNPVILKSIQNLSRYEAASGNFEVIVDIRHDNKYLPDWIDQRHIVLDAVGTVGVYVDFSTIGSGAITLSPDKKTVTIALPPPAMDQPNIDHTKSKVVDQDSGLVQKVGDLFNSDPNEQAEVWVMAEQKMTAAANAAGLQQRAEANTRQMLTGMMKSVGFDTVTVKFPAST